MNSPYLSANFRAPSWMADFRCIAERCPDTCCKGWNIPVDPAHAALYDDITQADPAHPLSGACRKIHVRKGKIQRDDVFLNLLSRPDERCALLTADQKCTLQMERGEFALCDTCFFYPRSQFQIDDVRYLTAGLACPAVRDLALLPSDPISFCDMQAFQDPQMEWLETELIPSPSVRTLLRQRDALLESLIQLIQNRAKPLAQRLDELSSAFLWLIEQSEQGNSTFSSLPKIIFKSPAEKPSTHTTQTHEKWIAMTDSAFNWLNETGSLSSRAADTLRNALLSGEKTPTQVMARNYLAGKSCTESFLEANETLMENFIVHTLFSTFLTQFSRYLNGVGRAADVLTFEYAQLLLSVSLLKQQFAANCLNADAANIALFLKTIGQIDRQFLHYPEYMATASDRFVQKAGSLADRDVWNFG